MSYQLRTIDRKRINQISELRESKPQNDDIWFIHIVLAQCFLPYRDPKEAHWNKRDGDFSISLTAGQIEDPVTREMKTVGLPYGAKPRLFQSYVCTQVIKQQSPVVPIERSMTAMIRELGFEPRGGQRGTINSFKDQITRFAACHFRVTGPGPRGSRRHVNTPPIKHFDIWFPTDPSQHTLWPSEIVLTDDYYYSLKDHAIPFDFRGMRAIQNKPRAQDIYLWMTQRLCRIGKKPLFMTWQHLYEMFGGASSLKEFKRKFPADLLAARSAYPDARMEEHTDGCLFRASPPPIPKIALSVRLPDTV